MRQIQPHWEACGSSVCNPTIATSNNRFSTGQGYSYDAAGDVTQDATGQRFHYDSEQRQDQFFAANNGGSTPDATYYYDGSGQRIKKVSASESTIFVYDAAGVLIEEYPVSAPTQVGTSYVYAGSLLSTETSSGTNYLTADHLGSPRIVTDSSGNVVSRKDFTAFGEETVTSQRITGLGYNPQNTRQDYTGYQKDNESGLEYAQARYYNATHGRFTGADSLTASATIRNPQTFNRYSYALNSPYKFVDPLGLMSQGSYSDTGFCGADSSYCSSDVADPFAAETQLQARNSVTLVGIRAQSLDSAGNLIQITKKDRKALQKSLRKLIPGAEVSKDGQISIPSGTSDSAASRLINGIAGSGQTVTIAVNHNNENKTYTPSEFRMRGHFSYNDPDEVRGLAVDSVVLWDPNRIVTEEEQVGPGQIKAVLTDPAVALAHELIHAYNLARSFPQRFAADRRFNLDETMAIKHYFTEGGVAYYETVRYEEFRTVGIGVAQPGDVTENQIRAQLGLRSRATYRDRADWKPAN